MNLSDRKNDLLKLIVEEYIKSAVPVSSGFIVEKYFPDLSSATIRNDMADLEKNGFICQPHTSAGRIPTVLGYKSYLDNFVVDGEITEKEKVVLDKIESNDYRQKIKDMAKTLADLSSNAIFVGFSKNDYFYTGISNLFRQPEFKENAYIYTMSEIIDHLDEALYNLAVNIQPQEVKVLLGNDNPFGEFSSVIVAKYDLNNNSSMIGLLGPCRLDYKKGLGLINYAKNLLSNN